VDIGVIGWWHQDNQGDFAILDCLTRALMPHRLVPIDIIFPPNRYCLQRLNLMDYLVLGGGGLIQNRLPEPFDTFDIWADQLETPIGVTGLGVDVVPPQHRTAMAALVEQARFFYVRDRASQEAVAHPEVLLAPDLTFLYPLPGSDNRSTGRRQPRLCGVNLRNAPQLNADSWIQSLCRLPLRLRGIPFSTFDTWQELSILQQIDETCATSFDPALYEDLDLMVGTAFHSVVFAIQAAVPVIGIAYAPKVRRLMTDIGLEQYVLEPDEYDKLPGLVERALGEHSLLVERLQATTLTLSESARRSMAHVRNEIERTAVPRHRVGPRASIVVVENGSASANLSTIESCLNQTYGNVEVIFVGEDPGLPSDAVTSRTRLRIVPGHPAESVGERLNRGLVHATGEYLSWAMAGSFYARDAIACMVHHLQQVPSCDMVYCDYFTVGERNRLTDIHPVAPADKLYRRDVVGPCFVYRQRLAEALGPFETDTPLVAYGYWLRAHEVSNLEPMHVALFYSREDSESSHNGLRERQVRRQWRSVKPLPVRIFWRVADTDISEKWVVRPLLFIMRSVRSRFIDRSSSEEEARNR
jgi:polysaccharide pyruvyl transferase WcaK-like protein